LSRYLALPSERLVDLAHDSSALPGTPGFAVTLASHRETRIARLNALRTLSQTSNVVSVVQGALASITNGWQRAELAEMLGRSVQSRESADALIGLLNDPDEQVRASAVFGLRLLSSRIDRAGRRGIQAEAAHPPKVQGLVPALIMAAKDPSALVRRSAAFALADTREPAAIQALREYLKDSEAEVRFSAACLLTEVHDPSGIAELKEVLHRLSTVGLQSTSYGEAEEVLLALERTTGLSFGDIPLNPVLASDGGKSREYAEQYRVLIKAWAAWLESASDGKGRP
jgi:hypothetical protein